MTDLSPAQKILAALSRRYELCGYFDDDWAQYCLAAALEAVADQVAPENYSGCTGDTDWDLGMESRNECIRDELFAIAAELRGTTPTETIS